MWWVYVLQSVPDAVTEHPVFGSEQVPLVPFAWLLEQLFIPHEVGLLLWLRICRRGYLRMNLCMHWKSQYSFRRPF
jgi:hypothetical protein